MQFSTSDPIFGPDYYNRIPMSRVDGVSTSSHYPGS